MQDLPQSKPSDDQQLPASISSIGGKEGEGISIATAEMPLKAVGQEIQLPKEALSAGVVVTPQTVLLPPQIVQAGVKAVGPSVPVSVQPANGLQLPLTDEQIAKALHENIKTSIRWLAEWCVRKIKMVHAKVVRKHH